ncbi:uncharacterized protein LOC143908826 [Temnothorax americanus]|uniref:uncharacterized protein LOC143908826 n=1 Tax=Temnothorax americanus TaxID=1964332 RepID=UPI0040691E16
MREEHARRERDYAETFRRQEEELCRLRGIISNTELSPSINRASGDSKARDASGAETRNAYTGERATVARAAVASGAEVRSVRVGESVAVASELGYKLKPDTYDGTVSLHEYFSQLNLIARANNWDDATKTIALASSLRGKARSVSEMVEDVERLDFAELKAKLELRFGEGRQSQNSYVAFTNRKQKFGEDLATLGSEIDRLRGSWRYVRR